MSNEPDFHAGLKLKRGSATSTRVLNGYMFEIDALLNHSELWHIAAPATFDGRLYEGTLYGRPMVFSSRRVGDCSLKVLNAEWPSRNVTYLFRFNVSSDRRTLVFTTLKLDEKTCRLPELEPMRFQAFTVFSSDNVTDVTQLG
jgi:hypothetical protein